MQSSLDIITSDNELTTILIDLQEHVDFLYAHSLAVSAISVLIARKMGWTSSTVLFKLAFAALFHDIGKKELPKELILKPRYQLTAQDRKNFESHTVRGKEILESIRNAPPEAVYVAFEHHENYLSNGYPRAVSLVNLHPFTKIVCVADSYCNYAVVPPGGGPILSPPDAIAKMKTKIYEMDKIAFSALSELIATKRAA